MLGKSFSFFHLSIHIHSLIHVFFALSFAPLTLSLKFFSLSISLSPSCVHSLFYSPRHSFTAHSLFQYFLCLSPHTLSNFYSLPIFLSLICLSFPNLLSLICLFPFCIFLSSLALYMPLFILLAISLLIFFSLTHTHIVCLAL